MPAADCTRTWRDYGARDAPSGDTDELAQTEVSLGTNAQTIATNNDRCDNAGL